MSKSIKYIALLFTVSLYCIYGCSKIEDKNSVGSQRDRIDKYLESNNISFTEDNGVYKTSMNRVPIPEQSRKLQIGDSLYYYFAEYTFFSKLESVYYTNMINLIEEGGFNTSTFSSEPRKIKYGYEKPPLLQGIDIGLNMSREGDSLMLFLTSDKAYGSKQVGIVDRDRSIAVFLVVDKIK